MAIPTAPDTLTVDAGSSTTTDFDLVNVSDNTLTYRATSLGGSAMSIVATQPVFTLQRRPETVQNGAVKYTWKYVHPSLNALGVVDSKFLASGDIVVPSQYRVTENDKVIKHLHTVFNALNTAFITGLVEDGTFPR